MNKCFVVVLLLIAVMTTGVSQSQTLSPQERQQTVERLKQISEEKKNLAWEKAKVQGWKISGEVDGRYYELMALDAKGRPVYNITDNVDAAISTGANLIRNTAPYNLNGAGFNIGIWDGGSVLSTHQEFGSRVTILDGASSHYHATHVGGTIGASGVDSDALGMAPSVNIFSYEWSNDSSEMTGEAASGPGQSTKIYISNHSYGTVTGWDEGDYSGTYGPHFWGDYPSEREDAGFGQYNYRAEEWDDLVYSNQYFLPFKSAGNDRNDNAPSNGTTFYYLNGSWQSATYDSSTGPYSDGYDGGYDTIPTYGVAKNIMTVGAVDDAVSGSNRQPSNGTMASFSGWGPTDDGRIKPDIVANGVSLYSTGDSSNSDYIYLSGTSMSSPNAAGSAQLLVEYYSDQFSGQAMRASTLKALILHTADDLGNLGPDYSNGWGLMNVKAAADLIGEHQDFPSANKMTEGLLSGSNPSDSITFKWDGSSPIRATLCWTDPSHTSVSGLDNTTSMLVNDLDLRILGPGGSPTYSPYILNPSSPSSNATTGDNTRDNVEQVYIASPGTSGVYTVQISHKSSLVSGQQRYSLILTGQAIDDLLVLPSEEFSSRGVPGGPFSPLSKVYTLSNEGSSAVNWTVSKTQDWITLSSSGGQIPVGGSTQVTVSINESEANLLTASSTPYTDTITFTNTDSTVSQNRSTILTVANEYYTEIFEGDGDLSNISLTFTPDGSGDFVEGCRVFASAFPTDPNGGTTLSLSDDGYTSVSLTGGAQLPFFGVNYTSFYVGSNGYITFGAGDDEYLEAFADHFDAPRISAHFDDLSPNVSGTVSWKQLADRVAVTYEDVPEWDETNSNNFQIEIYFDGTVCMTFLGMDSSDGLIGFSDGAGIPGDFQESDISGLSTCSWATTSVGDSWEFYR